MGWASVSPRGSQIISGNYFTRSRATACAYRCTYLPFHLRFIGAVGLPPLPARRLARAESSSSCSSLRVSSLLQSYQQHGGEGTRARPLCASCGTIGRPKRAFGSLLIAAHPQSTVPSPAARTRRDNTSRDQVPGVDDARLPGLLLHRGLRTRRPAAVPCGGRTCAGQNNCLPNHRRGLSRARSPAGSRQRRVALGSSAPPPAAALPYLWVLASGLARRAASGGARPFAAPPPQKA